jgi:hypothetical protein
MTLDFHFRVITFGMDIREKYRFVIKTKTHHFGGSLCANSNFAESVR